MNLTKGVSYWVYLFNLLINYFSEVHYHAEAGCRELGLCAFSRLSLLPVITCSQDASIPRDGLPKVKHSCKAGARI